MRSPVQAEFESWTMVPSDGAVNRWTTRTMLSRTRQRLMIATTR
jgi:hypothetical protein